MTRVTLFDASLRPDLLAGWSLPATSVGAQAGYRDRFETTSPWPAPVNPPSQRLTVFEGCYPVGCRDYQARGLLGIGADIHDHPWLGIAWPMQTGKSLAIERMIEWFYPQAVETRVVRNSQPGRKVTFDRVLILTASLVAERQILEDLREKFPEKVGQFDGTVKELSDITVGTIYSVPNHLDEFDPGLRWLVVLDEAYYTQAEKTVQKILKHLGLGQVIKGEEEEEILRPVEGSHSRLVGLSGTADGLAGYHISGILPLLDAIENRWVRHLIGKRIVPQVTTEEVRIDGERVIWWEPTKENALELARKYKEEVFYGGHGGQVMAYVPTIKHGRLLQEALGEVLPGYRSYFIHSDRNEDWNERDLVKWEDGGGVVISVDKLTRAYRGNEGTVPVTAIFHTFQTGSVERFSQRTGRGWAMVEGHQEPLRVFEVSWDVRGRFANLARLLGLVEDVFEGEIDTRRDLVKIRRVGQTQQLQNQVQQQIKLGSVLPYFEGIPVLEEWRRAFERVSENLEELSDETGLPLLVLRGYQMGALPVRKDHMERLDIVLEGRALEIWLKSWESVVDEVGRGMRSLGEEIGNELITWRSKAGTEEERAKELDEMLTKYFRFQTEIKRHIQLNYERVREAFQVVVNDPANKAKIASGEMRPQAIAALAHADYCAGLAEDQKPSQGTFRALVSGSAVNANIMKILETAGAQKRQQVPLDMGKAKAAFQVVVNNLANKAKIARGEMRPQAIAVLAHADYCAGLAEDQKPSQGTFRGLVFSRLGNPEILRILKSGGVKKRKYEFS